MKRRGQWQQHYVGNLARKAPAELEIICRATDGSPLARVPEALVLGGDDPLKAPFFAVGPELVRR